MPENKNDELFYRAMMPGSGGFPMAGRSSSRMDFYLGLERIMMDMDDRGDPLADQVRDLMDPLWHAMSREEHDFLDRRGEIDVRVLYPITLTVPDLFNVMSMGRAPTGAVLPENGIGRRFALKDAIPWAA